jgi:hypothetical protein
MDVATKTSEAAAPSRLRLIDGEERLPNAIDLPYSTRRQNANAISLLARSVLAIALCKHDIDRSLYEGTRAPDGHYFDGWIARTPATF